MRRASLLLGAIVSFLVASPALAQRAALLPTVSDADAAIVAPLEERAHAALTAGGWQVLTAQDAARQARRQRVRCEALECAPELARVLALDWVVRMRLWGTSSAIRQVVIALVSTAGDTREGSADVGPDGVDAAVDAAVAQALRRAAGIEDPVTCHVHGTPLGAAVVIDGQPAGVLPWSGPLEPGMHEVVVSHSGFASATRSLRASDGSRLVVELAPERAAAAESTTADDEATRELHPRRTERVTVRPIEHLVGPLALGALGLGLLAADAVALGTSGCDSPTEGGCLRSARFLDEGAFALWGSLGLASVVGAIVWWVLGEHTEERSVTALTPLLGPGYAGLRGTF